MDNNKTTPKPGSPGEKKRGAKSGPHVEKDHEQSLPDEAPVSTESSEDPATEPKPFDFGGLPDRNLKKNLGCG